MSSWLHLHLKHGPAPAEASLINLSSIDFIQDHDEWGAVIFFRGSKTGVFVLEDFGELKGFLDSRVL